MSHASGNRHACQRTAPKLISHSALVGSRATAFSWAAMASSSTPRHQHARPRTQWASAEFGHAAIACRAWSAPAPPGRCKRQRAQQRQGAGMTRHALENQLRHMRSFRAAVHAAQELSVCRQRLRNSNHGHQFGRQRYVMRRRGSVAERSAAFGNPRVPNSVLALMSFETGL